MNAYLDRLIPLALKALPNSDVVQNGTINRKYNGYIASFGASVYQSGMLAALAFNHRKPSKEEKDDKPNKAERVVLMKLLFEVIKLKVSIPEEYNTLLAYYQASEDTKGLASLILDVATALKLAMRTYEFVDPEENLTVS